MQKVAVVSQKATIEVFKALGCETFIVSGKTEALSLVEKLIDEQFALIFVASSLADQLLKELKKHSLSSATIISQIPG